VVDSESDARRDSDDIGIDDLPAEDDADAVDEDNSTGDDTSAVNTLIDTLTEGWGVTRPDPTGGPPSGFNQQEGSHSTSQQQTASQQRAGGGAAAVPHPTTGWSATETDVDNTDAPDVNEEAEPDKAGMWMTYVCFDIEVTGASRSVHEICQIGADIFRIQKPDGGHLPGFERKKYCKYVKSSDSHTWDSGLSGTGTHHIVTADVQSSEKYPEAMASFYSWIQSTTEQAISRDIGKMMTQDEKNTWTVCLVAHNGKATDFDWLVHLNSRFAVSPPSWLVWCWDTLPAVKLMRAYKIGKAAVVGEAGNRGHGLAEMYRVITGAELTGHHDAGADAAANAEIALVAYEKRLNKTGGMFTWSSYQQSKTKAVQAARLRLRPDLSTTPWEYVGDTTPSTGMPPPTGQQPMWGPKGDAAVIHENIEDYFLMYLEDTLQDVAEWTNYYAAEQPVKVIFKSKNRTLFQPCELGDDGQRWRCGARAAHEAWEPITKWHVVMVFGILLRGGSNRCRSIKELWGTYDNIGDELVREHCTKKHFLHVLQYLVCADFRSLDRTTEGKPTKLAKVKPILDKIQCRYRSLWDMSQRGCIDEATVLCKSRYCSFKQRNPQKPKRIHIKVYVLGCAESTYLCSFVVYEGAGSGTVADIIVNKLIPAEYSGMSKVITMDNFFTGHDVTHGLYKSHLMYHVGTVVLRDRKDKTQSAIKESDFPFRSLPAPTSAALPRGYSQVAKTTVRCPEQVDHPQYTKHATLLKDTKAIGLSHNVMFGRHAETTMTRRLRVGSAAADQTVASCEALTWYLDMYGVVDTIDQSTAQYPVDFRCSGHWYRRLLYWSIDTTMHNIWVLINWHSGKFDPNGEDQISKKKICYCQDSTVKRCKRRSLDDKKHHCYVDRDDFSGRLKIHKDMSRALIERASKELAGACKPGKRGRKRSGPDHPEATPPQRSKPTITHGHKHHKFADGLTRRPCFVCVRLKAAKKRVKPPQRVTTGCRNCSIKSGSTGVTVCSEHFNTDLCAKMHEVRFCRAQITAMNLPELKK
jgi:DNA polymerase III epsilon subunit-like protein